MVHVTDFAAAGRVDRVRGEEREAMALEAGWRGGEGAGVRGGDEGEGAAEGGVHLWAAGLVELALGCYACDCFIVRFNYPLL